MRSSCAGAVVLRGGGRPARGRRPARASGRGPRRPCVVQSAPVLDLYAELRRIVAALDAAGIPYALAGGLAVSIYTTPRATEDIDLLIARADRERAVEALGPVGFRPAARPMPVAGGRLEIQRLTKISGADLLPLDLLLPAHPDLAALANDREHMILEDGRIWVVGLRALRTLKRLRGSALDRADLEALGPEDR